MWGVWLIVVRRRCVLQRVVQVKRLRQLGDMWLVIELVCLQLLLELNLLLVLLCLLLLRLLLRLLLMLCLELHLLQVLLLLLHVAGLGERCGCSAHLSARPTPHTHASGLHVYVSSAAFITHSRRQQHKTTTTAISRYPRNRTDTGQLCLGCSAVCVILPTELRMPVAVLRGCAFPSVHLGSITTLVCARTSATWAALAGRRSGRWQLRVGDKRVAIRPTRR